MKRTSKGSVAKLVGATFKENIQFEGNKPFNAGMKMANASRDMANDKKPQPARA